MKPLKTTLYNGQSNNIVGYCHYHKCYITKRQLTNNKKCLQKNCDRFEKNENHEYWKQRERQKAKKKANKQIESLII